MQGVSLTVGRGPGERGHQCSFGWKRCHSHWEQFATQRCCGGSGSPARSPQKRRKGLRRRPVSDATLTHTAHTHCADELGDLKIHGFRGDQSGTGSTPGSSFQDVSNNVSKLVRPQPCSPSEPAAALPSEELGCPVYVMLPLDTVRVIDRGGRTEVSKAKELETALHRFREAGVSGIMVDVWWGIVERGKPKQYDFAAYRQLFRLVAAAGLKAQAVMSFHAAGGNVGDTCEIPLPKWVQEIGEENPDIYYTDKQGFRNKECLSLGCDHQPLFWGRTPIEMYGDFVGAFADEFQEMCGHVITEITVGLGPAGELRYPSYPEGDGRWCFPGVGEFQCYDKYMKASLQQSAAAAGHPEWGLSGPHDAGNYNSKCWETGFFNCHWGSFDSPYGNFFLAWYSSLLIQHADEVLSAVSEVLYKRGRPRVFKEMRTVGEGPAVPAGVAKVWNGVAWVLHHCKALFRTQLQDGCTVYKFEPAVKLGAKLAGVHWWFKTRAHAAELTAGYYNTRDRDGYGAIMDVLHKNNARLSFTCVEMRDCEHPPESMCSPQGLLKQVIDTSQQKQVPLAGENALQRYDEYAFTRITESAFGQNARAGSLEQITFLRMGGLMFDNWQAFSSFLERMRCLPTAAES